MQSIIIDDDGLVRTAFVTALKALGYACVGFESWQDAECQLDSIDPDVVFTDLNMPGDDGYDILRKLKARSKSVRVVVLSGEVDARKIQQFAEVGFDGQMSKPYSLQQLSSMLEKLSKK